MAISVSVGDRFESGHGRAQFVVIVLVLSIIIYLGSIGANLSQIGLISAAQSGEEVTEAQISDNDAHQATALVAQVVVVVLMLVALCVWFHRAYRNLKPLGGQNLKYSPAWAAGGFFVPILNLVRPYQVASEIWQISESTRPSTLASDLSPAPSLVKWWWFAFIVDALVVNFVYRLGPDVGTLSGLMLASKYRIASLVLSIISAILTWRLVTGIDSLQENRSRFLRTAQRQEATGVAQVR